MNELTKSQVMSKLALYYYDQCPFCQRVLRYMDDNNIEIPMKNVLEQPEFREELIGIGGRSSVPCLVIDGEALYESRDIVRWLEENWSAQ